MSTDIVDFNVLVEELTFAVAGPQTAVGEVQGVPTSLTILSSDPPGVMIQMRYAPDADQTDRIWDLLGDTPEETAKLDIFGESVWLSLYNLAGDTNESLKQLINVLAETIQSTDLRVEPGCLRCGESDSVELMFVAERPTRLCPNCLQRAVDQQQGEEEELNRTSVGATLGLPACMAILAAGWGAIWALLGYGLHWLGVQEIEINIFTVGIILGLTIGGAYLLSRLAIGTFRRSALVRQSPALIIGALVLTALLFGEVASIVLELFFSFGIFAPELAWQLAGEVLRNYSVFWIVCKFIMAIALILMILTGATARREGKIEV